MINQTIIQGRLVEVPTIKQINEKAKLCNITIAWNKKIKERETTLFIRCTFWNHNADFIVNYFTKGDPIIVSGELQTESWETDTGEKRSNITLTVNECHFCGSKKDNSKATPEQQKTQEVTQNFSVGDFFEADEDDNDDDFPY